MKNEIRLLMQAFVLDYWEHYMAHKTINACMEDKTFVTYLKNVMDKEATRLG